MKRKIITNLVALLTAFVLLFEAGNPSVYAELLNSDDNGVETSQESSELLEIKPKIMGEETEKREANAKSFRLDNGNSMMVLYPTNVHYSENNEWKDINNSFVSSINDNNEKTFEM